MKVRVLKPVTLTAQPGCIVEINDNDIKYLKGYVEIATEEKKEEKKAEPKEEPKAKPKAKAKK